MPRNACKKEDANESPSLCSGEIVPDIYEVWLDDENVRAELMWKFRDYSYEEFENWLRERLEPFLRALDQRLRGIRDDPSTWKSLAKTRECLRKLCHEVTRVIDGDRIVPDARKLLLPSWEEDWLETGYASCELPFLRVGLMTKRQQENLREVFRAMFVVLLDGTRDRAIRCQNIAALRTALASYGASRDWKEPARRRVGKWEHLWKLIVKMKAEKGRGTDATIARMHNEQCEARINAGKCKRITAKKVAAIRYDYTHPDRHRKQDH